MLDKNQLKLLRQHFQRIFAIKVNRTTFREIQNVIFMVSDQDQDRANHLFESLLTGKVSDKLSPMERDAKFALEKIIDDYCILARVAKEIFERGEFIHLITSDAVNQEQLHLFINRLARIDGEELQFVTDMRSSLHLINHYLSRILELTEKHKDVLDGLKDEVKAVQDQARALPMPTK